MSIDHFEILLGFIDNLHDFDNKHANKKIFEYLYNFLCKNGFNPDSAKATDIVDLIIKKDSSGKILFNTVNSYKIINAIKNKIIELKSPSSIKIDEINNIIIKNFDMVFNITKIKSLTGIEINLNTLISNELKIQLRQPLYFLIKYKNDEIIDFLLTFMNLDIFEKDIISVIKTKIKKNLSDVNLTKNNILYPITFFNDIENGLNLTNMKFNIFNYEKNKIDSASTSSIETAINKNKLNKNIKEITTTKQHSILVFHTKKTDVLEYLDAKFYLDDYIICEYKDIMFKIKENNVGRASKTTSINETIGIYNLVILLVNMYNDIDNINLNKNLEELKKYESIIVIDDIIDQLNKIKLLYDKDTNLGCGCIIFLLFGAKRYGDWIQVYLSKKYYFLLQTTDNYCKLYSLYSNSPIIFDDDTIYNYNVPDDLDTNFISTDFELIDNDGEKDIKYSINNEHLIYKGLRNIETNKINRYYFNKYIKYKTKYLKLKNNFK